MKVTVSTLNDDIFVLDVSEDLELENFKAFCEIESGFPAPEIVIVHNGKPLIDDKISIKTHGVRDGDVVILQHMSTSSSQANFSAPDNGWAKCGLHAKWHTAKWGIKKEVERCNIPRSWCLSGGRDGDPSEWCSVCKMKY